VVVDVGLTTRVVPDPTSVPQQLPAYQSTVQPLVTDAERVELAPPQTVVGFAETLVGTAGAEQGATTMASNAPALLTVVTATSRNMVNVVPEGVTVPLKVTQAVLVVPADRGVAAAREVPPAGSTSTVEVAEVEFVRIYPVTLYVVHGVHPVTV
jgi:hypothetical protein